MTSTDGANGQDGDFVNPLSSLLGYQLRRASAWILADLGQSLEDLDLKPTSASVLLLIDANIGITQSDVGRMLAIQRANMAPLVGALSERGLIEKLRADGRSHALRLTPPGTALVGEVRRRIVEHEARFLGHLGDAERMALIAQISTIWAL